jgi:hypothetical protein
MVETDSHLTLLPTPASMLDIYNKFEHIHMLSIGTRWQPYHLVWATKLSLAAIGLVFPALVLGYNFFTVKSMTYQFLYRLKNLYDYRWQQ